MTDMQMIFLAVENGGHVAHIKDTEFSATVQTFAQPPTSRTWRCWHEEVRQHSLMTATEHIMTLSMKRPLPSPTVSFSMLGGRQEPMQE